MNNTTSSKAVTTNWSSASVYDFTTRKEIWNQQEEVNKPIIDINKLRADFKEQLLNLLRPFARQRVEALWILELSGTSREEELYYNLWRLLGIPQNKILEWIQADRKNQVKRLLEFAWLSVLAANDTNYHQKMAA